MEYKKFWIGIDSGHEVWSKFPMEKSDTNSATEVIEIAALNEAVKLLKQMKGVFDNELDIQPRSALAHGVSDILKSLEGDENE